MHTAIYLQQTESQYRARKLVPQYELQLTYIDVLNTCTCVHVYVYIDLRTDTSHPYYVENSGTCTLNNLA